VLLIPMAAILAFYILAAKDAPARNKRLALKDNKLVGAVLYGDAGDGAMWRKASSKPPLRTGRIRSPSTPRGNC
jgi:hypothetical protein